MDFFPFQTPTIYEHIPLNLTDISVEAIPENVFDRKNVFRLKSDVGEDYSLLADSDSSMQSWIQALEVSISSTIFARIFPIFWRQKSQSQSIYRKAAQFDFV